MSDSHSRAITDNATMNRFELAADGDTAVLEYKRTDDAMVLIHTEVPAPLRGRRIGETLVEAAFQSARSAGLRIVAVCPFVKAYMRKHSSRR